MTKMPPRYPDDTDVDGGNTFAPQRPIPDGGLGSAMPDWLRQTPSWHRPAETRAVRSIPAPDTSEIDPRQLIDVDDLPQWLQSVSSRDIEPAPATTRAAIDLATPVPPEPHPSARTPDDTTALARVITSSPSPATIESPPADDDRHELVRLAPSPSAVRQPWWLSDAAVAVLFVGIILTMIYVILVASGVM